MTEVKVRAYINFLWKTIALFTIAVLLNYLCVELYSKPYVVRQTEDLPPVRTGMLLGTSKYTRRGKENLFYAYRIRTAAQLMLSGNLDTLIISGDNRDKYYNEPLQMQKDLMRAGVPAERIKLDKGGLSTYASIKRARQLYGLDSLIVISQDFHVKRAIFIGRNKGLKIWGVPAPMVSGWSKWRILLREAGARIKASWQVCFGKEEQPSNRTK